MSDSIKFTVQGEAFVDALKATSVAASKDKMTPLWTAVRVEVAGSEVRMVATDRFMLVQRRMELLDPAQGEGAFTLPVDALKAMAALAPRWAAGVTVDGDVMTFAGATFELMQGDYPRVDGLLASAMRQERGGSEYMALDLAIVARLEKARTKDERRSKEPTHFVFPADRNKPLLAHLSEDARAIVMPRRSSDWTEPAWS